MNRSCFLFVLLVMAFLAYSEVPASAAPKIDVKEKVFNFGEMVEGQTVEHAYKVQNRGDQPLEIRRLKPT